FQNKSNSQTAFQIQDAAGTANIFVVDTINGRIGINTASPTHNLEVNGSINGTTVYQNGNQVCDTSGNCVGVGGGAIGGSGTVGTIALFTGTGFTIGDSLLTQSGSTVTDTGLFINSSNNA